MNVTIDHAPYKVGINVITAVQFTNEERAIIQKSKLDETELITDASIPATTTTQFVTDRVFTFIAGTILIVGLIGSMLLALARDGSMYATVFALLFLAGVVLVLIAAVFRFRNIRQDVRQNTTYTVRSLINGPVTLYAENASIAKALDDEMRKKLIRLKAYIDDNRELRSKESFEL